VIRRLKGSVLYGLVRHVGLVNMFIQSRLNSEMVVVLSVLKSVMEVDQAAAESVLPGMLYENAILWDLISLRE